MCLKRRFVCLLDKTTRRDGLDTGYKRRNAGALIILILMGAGLTSNFIVKANSAPADTPAAETGGETSFSGLPSDPEGSQTSSFLTILSSPPYIVGQPLSLKGGVLPGRSGTMSFYDGTTLLGAAPLRLELNGSMQAALLTPGLTEGLHILTAVYDGNGAVSPSKPVYVARQATSVSSANYRGEMLAPDQVTATFGVRLANSPFEERAASLPLPTTLGGTTVSVSDSAGMTRAAPLFYVSLGQVNHLIPAGTAAGPATITITAGDGTVSATSAQITAIAPGVFTVDSTGRGLAAAQVLRVKPDGSFRYEPVAKFDQLSRGYLAVPIDLSAESDQVFLILYGTGFHHRSSLSAAMATIGGVNADVLYAGAQGVLAGLDQANLRLPRSLMGRGEVDVALTVAGKAANTVRVSIK